MRSVMIALGVLSILSVPAGSAAEKLLFKAGFAEIADPPQTAPMLPLDTQPAPAEAGIDFNNLKDPKFTPTFQTRDPVKYRVNGFSVCHVNVHGSMEIDLQADDGEVWMRGTNPKVSGYIGKRFLDQDPTRIEATVRRLQPEEGGVVYLWISDVITNAYVMIASFRGEDNQGAWAINYNDNGGWDDWKVWLNTLGANWTQPVKLAIGVVRPGVFQAYVNDKPVGPELAVPNLRHLTEMRVACDAREKGVRVVEVAAWRDESQVSNEPSTLDLTVSPLDKTAFTPTNPYGNAIQIDYPFRGASDAMNDPELFPELVHALQEMRIRLIRFPGGNSAYWYSIHGPESMDGFRKLIGDYPLDRSKFGWADAREFFKLCKEAGADAVFQLNLGYWYDPETKEAYRIALQDTQLSWPAPEGVDRPLDPKVRPLEYHLDKFQNALDDAKTLVRWAAEIGVKVIWEFGNEDMVYFCPKTYVGVSHEFYKAIKEVDPNAQFAIYGDGITWSDWSWPFAVFEEMARVGMKDIAYTSHHEYLFGGTGIPFSDGQHVYDGGIAAWSNIARLRDGVRKKLDELGYTHTQLAMTEGNFAAGGPLPGAPHEHGMGRSLAEAWIFPARIKKHAMLVHHDLVRSVAQEGTWFCRIFYFPENPKGERYELPLPAQVMKIMGDHALREIIFDFGGVTVSQWTDGLLVTVGNALATPRPVRLTLDGSREFGPAERANGYRSEDLDTMAFETIQVPVTTDGRTCRITAPPFSFCYFKIPAK